MLHEDPLFIIVDIRDVLTDFSVLKEQYTLYNRFPLRDIVETILISAAYEDNGEFLWGETERRLHEIFNYIDVSMLAIFYETVTEYLDLTIQRKVPSYVDTYKYVFHRWLDGNTVMMTYDTNAQCIRGT